MAYLIGIDASTTATKALLIDDRGEIAAVAATEYDFQTPHPLWSEQDPALWWMAQLPVCAGYWRNPGFDSCCGRRAAGLTGQMHGLVLVDAAGQVLRPSILWNDQRTASQCDEIRARLGKSELVRITGNDALTGSTAPKILWVQENEPENLRPHP